MSLKFQEGQNKTWSGTSATCNHDVLLYTIQHKYVNCCSNFIANSCCLIYKSHKCHISFKSDHAVQAG